jgi:hypothetical protein
VSKKTSLKLVVKNLREPVPKVSAIKVLYSFVAKKLRGQQNYAKRNQFSKGKNERNLSLNKDLRNEQPGRPAIGGFQAPTVLCTEPHQQNNNL